MNMIDKLLQFAQQRARSTLEVLQSKTIACFPFRSQLKGNISSTELYFICETIYSNQHSIGNEMKNGVLDIPSMCIHVHEMLVLPIPMTRFTGYEMFS